MAYFRDSRFLQTDIGASCHFWCVSVDVSLSMLRRRERDNKYSAVDLVWNEACGSCQHQLYRFSCSKTSRSAFSNKTINNCPIWKASCHLQHYPCQFYYLLLMADHLNLPYHLNFKLLYSFQWTSLPFFLLSNDFIMKYTINTTSFSDMGAIICGIKNQWFSTILTRPLTINI